jgi:hypothetical protein
VGATGFEPVTSSVSGKNQDGGSDWHRTFPQINGGTGVSGTDRGCPLLSGGPCPRCAPGVMASVGRHGEAGHGLIVVRPRRARTNVDADLTATAPGSRDG